MDVWHSGKVTKISKSMASQHALHLGVNNIVVRNLVLPRVPLDLTKYYLMDYFKFPDVSSVE